MKEHLEKIKMERDVVVKEFDQLHQFEQEQKSFLLDQLKELQKEVEEEQKSKAENADNLDALIRDMEAICHQSDHDFLQDINNTLTRSRNFQMPVSTSRLTPKLTTFSQKNAALRGTLINLKETFTSMLRNYEQQQKERPLFHPTQQAYASMICKKGWKFNPSSRLKVDSAFHPSEHISTPHSCILSTPRKNIHYSSIKGVLHKGHAAMIINHTSFWRTLKIKSMNLWDI
ncbi:uncharacterized protein LOC143831604 isoform X1 [Paroedura picta]|uniref:uncharacterized protein LOC143831604 isoform X1 n=1 Tax=Paroedura picta TaxID=143630 RepID=UPI004056C935